MIFDMVIYITLIKLTEMECILLLLQISYLFLFRCLEFLTLNKSKRYFVEMKTSNICFITNVNVYKFSIFIKTDNYLEKKCCLIINLKKTGFKSHKIPFDI